MKKQLFFLALVAASLFVISCNTGNEGTGETISETPAKTTETKPQPAPEKRGLQIGEQAPDFELQNIDERMVSLRDFPDAKGFIVTFTCNTCPYSAIYEDRIIAMDKQFAPMGYPVIAVQPNDPAVKKGDSMEEMQKRAAEKEFTFPYLMDDGSVTSAYGATRTPEIYLLDKNRTLRYTGAIDDNAQDAAAVRMKYVEAAIQAMEAGQDPEPEFVKALGCTIRPRTPKQS